MSLDIHSNECIKVEFLNNLNILIGMFVGLRKIVGGKDNVEEELERTPEKIVATPCLNKSNKKRKVCENGAAFSAKKK